MGDSTKILSSDAVRPGRLLALLVAGVAWFVVIRMVWSDWRIDPQYSYGLLVPLLMLGLMMKRWEDRPAPGVPERWLRILVGAAILMAAVLLAAVIPVAEANPDWRPLGGVAATASIIISLCLIVLEGGLPWLRHFAFPVVFFLIAVPWPRNFEQSLMSVLMSWNAATTVEILHWCGYEAVRQGNLIVISSGILGIEEACSGIRSLQSGLMVALFFGEIFRLTIPRRIILLVIALLAALTGNILRSSFLGILASRQGMAAVPEWHDSAGLFILLMTFLIVITGAFQLRPSKSRGVFTMLKSETPAAGGVMAGMALHTALPVLVFTLLILAGSLVMTEIWFGMHDLPRGDYWAWKIAPRNGVAGVSRVPVAEGTLRMLFHPEGFSEKWIGERGEAGQVFFFQWPAGRTAVQSVQMHSPEVCLASMGMHMERPLADFETGSPGGPRLHAWLFTQGGRPVYVFHSIMEQEGGALENQAVADQTPIARIASVGLGKRNRGQRMLEVALWNLQNESEARSALASYLSDSLKDNPAPFLKTPPR
jgi:exosortase